jgi:hypothetical protein
MEVRGAVRTSARPRLGRILALAAILAVAVTTVCAARRKQQVVWQQSQSPCVQLAVRDKLGTLGAYTTVFRVSAPDGLEYTATKRTVGDGWGKAYFPSDFVRRDKSGQLSEAWLKPGRYSWKAGLSGRQVLSGEFEVEAPRLVHGVHVQSVTTLDPL